MYVLRLGAENEGISAKITVYKLVHSCVEIAVAWFWGFTDDVFRKLLPW